MPLLFSRSLQDERVASEMAREIINMLESPNGELLLEKTKQAIQIFKNKDEDLAKKVIEILHRKYPEDF